MSTLDEQKAAEFTAALWQAMKDQEDRAGLSGEEKKDAVKAILRDSFSGLMGDTPWMGTILDATIDLLVEVDRADQSLNLKSPCSCLPFCK